MLSELSKIKSQYETRLAIFDLLREQNNKEIPPHVLIPMDSQEVGNCGWMQVKTMIMAAVVVSNIGHLDDLPDEASPRWQTAIRDGYKVQADFDQWDMIKRAEALIFMRDPDFKPKFLPRAEQDEINSRRHALDDPVPIELLVKLSEEMTTLAPTFANTIYEQQFSKLSHLIQLEVAVDSEAGAFLQLHCNKDRSQVKTMLEAYGEGTMDQFDKVGLIYSTIKGATSAIADQCLLLEKVIGHMATEAATPCNFIDFLDRVILTSHMCITKASGLNQECFIEHIE